MGKADKKEKKTKVKDVRREKKEKAKGSKKKSKRETSSSSSSSSSNDDDKLLAIAVGASFGLSLYWIRRAKASSMVWTSCSASYASCRRSVNSNGAVEGAHFFVATFEMQAFQPTAYC